MDASPPNATETAPPPVLITEHLLRTFVLLVVFLTPIRSPCLSRELFTRTVTSARWSWGLSGVPCVVGGEGTLETLAVCFVAQHAVSLAEGISCAGRPGTRRCGGSVRRSWPTVWGSGVPPGKLGPACSIKRPALTEKLSGFPYVSVQFCLVRFQSG